MPNHSFSSMKKLFESLLSKNIPFAPVAPKSKAPSKFYNQTKWIGYNGWTKIPDNPPSSKVIESWATWPEVGVAVFLGESSNLIALDFDLDLEFSEKLFNSIPLSPLRKVGERGFTAFYRYNSEKSRKWLSPKGNCAVELLSSGRLTIIPPSIHPCGDNYRWVTEHTLCNFDLSTLPILPDTSEINKLLGIETKNPKEQRNQITDVGIDLLKQALSFINPDCNREDWLYCGMGIHSVFSGKKGLALFDNWSSKGEKYKSGEPERLWRGFSDHNEGITPGTVFKLAVDNGWKEPPQLSDALVENLITNLNGPALEIKTETKKPKTVSLSDDFYLKAPGLVGDITRYMNEVSRDKITPIYFNSALSFVGALKGHRVKTTTGLRTNFFTMALAPSGAGKNFAKVILKSIVSKFPELPENFWPGTPKSASGLEGIIQDSDGRCFVFWDEIGMDLKQTLSNKHNYSNYLRVLMEVFSDAQATYRGGEFSRRVRTNRDSSTIIDQPCFGIFGVSTPIEFYSALSSAESLSGFLPRWLILDCGLRLKSNGRKLDLLDTTNNSKSSIPYSILAKIQEIQDMPTNVGSHEVGSEAKIEPTIIEFSNEAASLINEKNHYYNDLYDETLKKDDFAHVFWARALEHIMKVSLCLTDGHVIEKSVVDWSIAFVENSVFNGIEAVRENVADTEFGKLTKKLEQSLIKAGPNGITRTNVFKSIFKCHLTKRELESVIETLRIGQILYVFEKKNHKKGRAAIKYVHESYVESNE